MKMARSYTRIMAGRDAEGWPVLMALSLDLTMTRYRYNNYM
jgi:hypothetical protein